MWRLREKWAAVRFAFPDGYSCTDLLERVEVNLLPNLPPGGLSTGFRGVEGRATDWLPAKKEFCSNACFFPARGGYPRAPAGADLPVTCRSHRFQIRLVAGVVLSDG